MINYFVKTLTSPIMNLSLIEILIFSISFSLFLITILLMISFVYKVFIDYKIERE